MTRSVFNPAPPPVPDVPRVLWRSGTPPSKAGARLERCAGEAIRQLSEVMRPQAQTFTGTRLPDVLEGCFGNGLEGASAVTVLIATLGRGVDERLDELLGAGLFLPAHMFDSAASEAVELLAAAVQLRSARCFPGMCPTARLAPGYRGVPLEVQASITGLFPGMGVACTENYYLVPAKTITGVWGWVRQKN